MVSSLQGVHRGVGGVAGGVDRSGHHTTTRTTDLPCRHLHVCPDFIHFVCEQNSCKYLLNDTSQTKIKVSPVLCVCVCLFICVCLCVCVCVAVM